LLRILRSSKTATRVDNTTACRRGRSSREDDKRLLAAANDRLGSATASAGLGENGAHRRGEEVGLLEGKLDHVAAVLLQLEPRESSAHGGVVSSRAPLADVYADVDCMAAGVEGGE
jgi:hypothetical protein